MGRPSGEGKPPSTSFERMDFAARTAGTTASPPAIRAAIAEARAHPVPCGSPRRAPTGGRSEVRPPVETMSVPEGAPGPVRVAAPGADRRKERGSSAGEDDVGPPASLPGEVASLEDHGGPGEFGELFRGLRGVGEGDDPPIQHFFRLGQIGSEHGCAPQEPPIRRQGGRGEEQGPGGGAQHGIDDDGEVAVRGGEGEDRLRRGARPHHTHLDGPEAEALRGGREGIVHDIARDRVEAGEGGGGLHREARDDRAGVGSGRRRRTGVHHHAGPPGRIEPSERQDHRRRVSFSHGGHDSFLFRAFGASPSFVANFRSVFRWTPRIAAARIWFPPVASRTAFTRGRSTWRTNRS